MLIVPALTHYKIALTYEVVESNKMIGFYLRSGVNDNPSAPVLY